MASMRSPSPFIKAESDDELFKSSHDQRFGGQQFKITERHLSRPQTIRINDNNARSTHQSSSYYSSSERSERSPSKNHTSPMAHTHSTGSVLEEMVTNSPPLPQSQAQTAQSIESSASRLKAIETNLSSLTRSLSRTSPLPTLEAIADLGESCNLRLPLPASRPRPRPDHLPMCQYCHNTHSSVQNLHDHETHRNSKTNQMPCPALSALKSQYLPQSLPRCKRCGETYLSWRELAEHLNSHQACESELLLSQTSAARFSNPILSSLLAAFPHLASPQFTLEDATDVATIKFDLLRERVDSLASHLARLQRLRDLAKADYDEILAAMRAVCLSISRTRSEANPRETEVLKREKERCERRLLECERRMQKMGQDRLVLRERGGYEKLCGQEKEARRDMFLLGLARRLISAEEDGEEQIGWDEGLFWEGAWREELEKA